MKSIEELSLSYDKNRYEMATIIDAIRSLVRRKARNLVAMRLDSKILETLQWHNLEENSYYTRLLVAVWTSIERLKKRLGRR